MTWGNNLGSALRDASCDKAIYKNVLLLLLVYFVDTEITGLGPKITGLGPVVQWKFEPKEYRLDCVARQLLNNYFSLVSSTVKTRRC